MLLVFHQIGARPARGQMKKVAELTRAHWKGSWDREDQFHRYDGKIPIVATTLDLLRDHGPAGRVFWRFGRDHYESLLDAIGNPRMDAALADRRKHEEARRAAFQADQQRREEEKARADRASLRRWAYTYAQRAFIRYAERMGREVLVEDVPETALELPGPGEERAGLQEQEVIAQMRALTPLQRQVMALTLVDWSPTEIAEFLGITAGAVRVSLHRARRVLTDRLNVDGK
ncbi:RNA polymerase sigma factor [Streptomyces rectiviolaceus]|uniref:RNA polymerase sigma factor n=1 Tax=Streptomyces rectiviolaceus TaxID=332591 RepID=UPI0031CE6698